MLIDVTEVTFKAGNGGNGKVSFRRNKKGPDGGSGGNGGNILVRGVNDIFLLNQFTQDTVILAENGEHGADNQRTGHGAKDIIINLPIGTSIFDKTDHHLVCELTKVDEEFLLCKGGKGGKGNSEFKSAQNPVPNTAQPGEKGQKLMAILSLKLIADFGLIGLPNAGKSSLLNELTSANAKTGNYEFTTLEPNLGVLKGKVIADIPGLIEGASTGRGLGIGFLKHIEKVGVLLHCISAESKDVVGDYKIIRAELANYNPKMLEKKEIIIVTKTDLVDQKIVKNCITKLKKYGDSVIPVSVHNFAEIQNLKEIFI